MLLTTSPVIQNKEIVKYHGIVGVEVVLGANIFRDFFSVIRDIFGGRTRSYEYVFKKGRETVLKDLNTRAAEYGGNAVVGINFDYETIGRGILMVAATGTAVTVK